MINDNFISKEESEILKGVAIIMMIWLHCFICFDFPEYSYKDIYIEDKPLAYYICNICRIVVALYCFISGYGLSVKDVIDKKYIAKKIWTLYRTHWLILVVFLTIEMMYKGDITNVNLTTILSNFTGYDTSYNSTVWFLLPYCIVLIITSFLCKYKNLTFNLFILFFFFIILVISSVFLKKNAASEIHLNIAIITVCNSCLLLFPFWVGRVIYLLPIRIKELYNKHRSYILVVCSFLLLAKAIISSTFISYLYALPVVLIVKETNMNTFLRTFIISLGRLSTPMWLIHAWFVYYTFSSVFFALKYPPIIFIFVLSITYLISFIFNKLQSKI